MEFVLEKYSPLLLAIAYEAFRDKYFSDYRVLRVNPDDFRDLAQYLEREQINYQKYFDFAFGLRDIVKPPTPKSLANPLLVQQFRQMTR